METQNNNNIHPEDLGGTTNLSLDQLKAEGGIASPTEDNPNTDAYESVTSDHNLGIDDDEQNKSPNDADGNGEPANPNELNS